MLRHDRFRPIDGITAVLAVLVFLILATGSGSPATGSQSIPSGDHSLSQPDGLEGLPPPGGLSAKDFTVEFDESGLPNGTKWAATLNELRTWSSSRTIQFSEPKGSYYWGVTTSASFTVTPAPAGVVTVNSSGVTVDLKFSTPMSTHPIQHVVVIVLENEGASEVAAYGTYENYLEQRYGEATSYYAACHTSAPNYLSMVAAVANQCNSNGAIGDAYHTYDNTTLGDLIQNSGQFSWAQFSEGFPSTFNCSSPGTPPQVGLWAAKHVPFTFFENSTTSPPSGYGAKYCPDHIESSSVFNGSAPGGINSTSFVNFSFYSPNLCDDGHNYCTPSPVCPPNDTGCDEVRQADTWLKGLLGPLLNGTGRYAGSPVADANVAHTAFLITYDESGNPLAYAGYPVAGATQGSAYGYCTVNSVPAGSHDSVCGGNVPLMVVSPFGTSDEKMTVDSAPFSVAATVEWLFGLEGPTGNGMDNPGHYDYKYRWADPGFPTFEWLLGISGDGYRTTN
jgi:hypothetical protein